MALAARTAQGRFDFGNALGRGAAPQAVQRTDRAKAYKSQRPRPRLRRGQRRVDCRQDGLAEANPVRQRSELPWFAERGVRGGATEERRRIRGVARSRGRVEASLGEGL